MPIPALLRKQWLSIKPASMARASLRGPANRNWQAARGCSGTPKTRAKALPEPVGTTPSTDFVFSRARPTSLTVPSPPTATTRLIPSVVAERASSSAWPRYSVWRTSAVRSRPKASSRTRARSMRLRPAVLLTTKRAPPSRSAIAVSHRGQSESAARARSCRRRRPLPLHERRSGHRRPSPAGWPCSRSISPARDAHGS